MSCGQPPAARSLRQRQTWRDSNGPSPTCTLHSFAGWRLLAGEGLFKNTFTNSTQTTQWVGIAPNLPMSIIVPLDMSSVTGSSLNCKRGVWLAGHDTVRVMPKILPAQNCAACCCGQYHSRMNPICAAARPARCA